MYYKQLGKRMKMSIIRDMLIITYKLGNASLLCWPLLETDWLLLSESLLEPLVFPFMHTLP